MPESSLKTIRVIEWDAKPRRSRPALPDPTIYLDTFQVLEWILRQALLSGGWRIGFEKPCPQIRVNRFSSPAQYVEAILREIKQHEAERKLRFRAAKELYAHYQEEEIAPTTIANLELEIGVTGKDAATYAPHLSIDSPQNLLGYGFEHTYFPLINHMLAVGAALTAEGITRGVEISAAQKRKIRRKVGGVGRYLNLNRNGTWEIDFTKSEFIKDAIFYTSAVFQPFFSSGENRYPTNRFIRNKLAYMFRDDKSANNSTRELKRLLSAPIIRGRIHGNRSYLARIERSLVTDKFVNTRLYSYLQENSHRIRRGIDQYLR